MHNSIYSAVTDFIFVEEQAKNSDIIFIPGGSKPQLAEKAAELWKVGVAKFIMPSGSTNKKIIDHPSEAKYLNSILIKNGVRGDSIFLEENAKNTMENALYSKKLLNKKGVEINSAVLVCKHYHSRRVLLSYQYVFGEDVEFAVCPIIDNKEITKDNWFKDPYKIEVVMNEVEKIGKYFKKYFVDLF